MPRVPRVIVLPVLAPLTRSTLMVAVPATVTLLPKVTAWLPAVPLLRRSREPALRTTGPVPRPRGVVLPVALAARRVPLLRVVVPEKLGLSAVSATRPGPFLIRPPLPL